MTFISVFDMFKIGRGPSSSHTLGPWLAAKSFVNKYQDLDSIHVKLFGSLALTGKGHFTDKALILGFSNLNPESVTSKTIDEVLGSNELGVVKPYEKNIFFDKENNIDYRTKETLPFHSNGIEIKGILNNESYVEVYFSIGGGFIYQQGEQSVKHQTQGFTTGKELLLSAQNINGSIAKVVLSKEIEIRPELEVYSGILNIWNVMKESAYVGCHKEGVLPGGLFVKRRAAQLNKELIRNTKYSDCNEWVECIKEGRDFKKVMLRVSCIAMAVNEVNANMGRVVTAPTNGSAGVIPAVLFYYICFSGQDVDNSKIIDFFLTASAIGSLFKQNATISAAAGGCQAEIGVSSAMAAAGLTEVLGGTPEQVLSAAEIAMEHHLGLTCDPIKGLVQIPCIERNSMGAIKAINATMLALVGSNNQAKVSIDDVIVTMNETAKKMHHHFKETSLGGLAVNVGVNLPEC